MDLDSLYRDVILDHYKNPHGKGLTDPYDAEVHHVNPTCGDEITLRVHLVPAEDGGDAIVESVSFDGQGCSISQASASVMHDQVIGQTVGQAFAALDQFSGLMRSATEDFTPDEELLGDGIAFEGVAKYPARIKCALLGWMAFKGAVAQATAARETTSMSYPPSTSGSAKETQ